MDMRHTTITDFVWAETIQVSGRGGGGKKNVQQKIVAVFYNADFNKVNNIIWLIYDKMIFIEF